MNGISCFGERSMNIRKKVEVCLRSYRNALRNVIPIIVDTVKSVHASMKIVSFVLIVAVWKDINVTIVNSVK